VAGRWNALTADGIAAAVWATWRLALAAIAFEHRHRNPEPSRVAR
jgi:hypothetical protein